ncbi:manganese transporter [candidate division KSB3 bacterium]|uniref:Manganese transporter n=1 Tax=candidate division KSB3 bacterium TaxID=2044937 RepID=A0A2G6KI69_9BACT|nr:MAG: manganese transporter [candidate division KSB3 bacterium]
MKRRNSWLENCGSLLLIIVMWTAVPADAAPLNVLATTGMIADVAANVGGDLVSMTALMGPGVDPHLYQATAGDVGRMRKADIILYNGLHLEAGIQKVLEKMDEKAVAVTDDIPREKLLPWENTYDPHVWMDPSLWKIVVGTIRDILSARDPEHADTYRQQAAAYLEQLEDLNAHVSAQIASIPEARRTLITAHDAFNYFSQAYDIEVRALMGISTETEAGTKDVQDLAAFIAETRVKAMFIESSVPEKYVKAVQKAVEQKGFDVQIGGELFSDAMGEEGTPEGTYIGMITHNADTIARALK